MYMYENCTNVKSHEYMYIHVQCMFVGSIHARIHCVHPHTHTHTHTHHTHTHTHTHVPESGRKVLEDKRTIQRRESTHGRGHNGRCYRPLFTLFGVGVEQERPFLLTGSPHGCPAFIEENVGSVGRPGDEAEGIETRAGGGTRR